MRVLILEDEAGAAQNLLDILKQTDPTILVLDVLETVQDAIEWLGTHPAPDLGLFDIRLADGDSFQVVEQVDMQFPIIFTTAYDEYALKAFKVNSIDYLLKPVEKAELESAIKKYKTLFERNEVFSNKQLKQLIEDIGQAAKYKKAFLIHHRGRMIPVNTDKIAYFYLDNSLLKVVTFDNKHFILDQTLNEVEGQVDPEDFYRANRQFIVSRSAIKAADHFFHRKLKLDLAPTVPEDVLISKVKVGAFMQWLGGEG